MKIKDYFLNERPVLPLDKMIEMAIPGIVIVNELRRKFFHEKGMPKIGHIQMFGDLEYSYFDELEKAFILPGYKKVFIKRNRYGRFLVSNDVTVSNEKRPRTKPSEIKQYCLNALEEYKKLHPEHADVIDMIVKYDINKESFDL